MQVVSCQIQNSSSNENHKTICIYFLTDIIFLYTLCLFFCLENQLDFRKSEIYLKDSCQTWRFNVCQKVLSTLFLLLFGTIFKMTLGAVGLIFLWKPLVANITMQAVLNYTLFDMDTPSLGKTGYYRLFIYWV